MILTEMIQDIVLSINGRFFINDKNLILKHYK